MLISLDLTNNRLVPKRDGAAARRIAEYDEAEEHFTLYTTSQKSSCRRALVLSAFYNIAPEHKLRVIAPDVGGGFGSKIYIYPEEMVALWASKKVRRPVKWTGDRSEAFLTDAHGPRSCLEGRNGFRQGQQDHWACGSRPTPISAAYMSLFSSSVPTYLYATLLSGPVQHSGHLRRGDGGLHQHHAGRRLSRRRGRPEGELSAGADDGDRGTAS